MSVSRRRRQYVGLRLEKELLEQVDRRASLFKVTRSKVLRDFIAGGLEEMA